MFLSSFRELSKEERYIIDQMSQKFREKEYESLQEKQNLPPILRFPCLEMNQYHKWLLRWSYDIFCKNYSKRFARKVARELIEEDGMGLI